MSNSDTTRTVAQTLKRLYPHNPDVVLGREARVIVEELRAAGYLIVQTGCLHDVTVTCRDDGTAWPHDRNDIIAMIERGDFG